MSTTVTKPGEWSRVIRSYANEVHPLRSDFADDCITNFAPGRFTALGLGEELPRHLYFTAFTGFTHQSFSVHRADSANDAEGPRIIYECEDETWTEVSGSSKTGVEVSTEAFKTLLHHESRSGIFGVQVKRNSTFFTGDLSEPYISIRPEVSLETLPTALSNAVRKLIDDSAPIHLEIVGYEAIALRGQRYLKRDTLQPAREIIILRKSVQTKEL
ncbi:hypothetical protein M231_04361 [Tremella mesenterica]|uniref:Uncharacterized protein n=2 Tax=Tremella mesenterica TaxID=5217 RepID=A0A4Q1BKP3_TREME|nr:hypothetical protein M231_04361 [Tremella mesenterica]